MTASQRHYFFNFLRESDTQKPFKNVLAWKHSVHRAVRFYGIFLPSIFFFFFFQSPYIKSWMITLLYVFTLGGQGCVLGQRHPGAGGAVWVEAGAVGGHLQPWVLGTSWRPVNLIPNRWVLVFSYRDEHLICLLWTKPIPWMLCSLTCDPV